MTVTDLDAFASRTGTKRNLDALRAAGWGLFVAAAGVHTERGSTGSRNTRWSAGSSG